MKHSLITRSFIIAGIVVATSANAAGTWTEARGDAMGGTGVASSHYSAAALVNPALLTKFDKSSDDFSLILPAVGAQVSDPDNLEDGVDRINNDWKSFERIISASGDASLAASKLRGSLQDFSGSHAKAHAGASTVAAVPNSVLPFAVVAKAWGTATVKTNVTDTDLQWLDGVSNGTANGSDLSSLTSSANGRAAVVADVGVAMAREFNVGGFEFSAGITPKVQRVYTFNYNVAINNYDSSDFRSGNYRNDKTGANVDVGFSTNLSDNWIVGLVGQNLVARSIETKEVNGVKDTFKIKPQATLGTAYSNGFFTTALDVDLTPASRFNSDKDSQFVSVGGELNAWKWAQLRAGYRTDIHDSDNSYFTAGIGLSPFDVVHLDITGMAGTDRTYGAVAQLTFTF
ncbi:conjugal transfer protein TraF [Pectobacterium versatile]|uniref:conjugal transfer protein TraF n=1 Tax=Pectobacterium TaxID=122277 RepID=UPI0018DF8DEF|nr:MULTISPECIES: conjugal transfer protein TraF [Pectobacterium]MBI0473162.1 conjugal transfer protein TraF [Pectobacterium parmentieri]MBI0495775.1 conjugal transfer protein TraF [Pectobacterium parmentieri]MBI0570327.1 conjugal transfer protein TraF [Pectobacterium parmentieri]MBI0575017.1 conjugal transfer protein TraF [Pectobacterium parmentieri]MCQ8232869.1 conjugal transfer protein TraF [Pectobacterium carotovorum]